MDKIFEFKDVNMYIKWLREEFDKTSIEKSVVNDTIDRIESYGLIEEVVEWTKRGMSDGFPFSQAVYMAMDEWDI